MLDVILFIIGTALVAKILYDSGESSTEEREKTEYVPAGETRTYRTNGIHKVTGPAHVRVKRWEE